MSAAIAVHSEAWPERVKATNTAFTAIDRTMLVRMTAYVSLNAEREAEHKKLVRTQELVRLGAAT